MPFASRLALLFALGVVLSAPATFAQVPDKAYEAYVAGHFTVAAMLAEADGSADALAFAARSRIADAIARDKPGCLDCLTRAEAAARAAIARDAALTEGWIQLAIAIGFRGRLVGSVEAQSEGLAEQGRAAIDRALELEPDNVWARASLGSWHLEIVRRAGSLLASILYGASEDEGLTNFRKAIAADPTNVLLQFNYALALLALDRDRFESEADAALIEGIKDAREDALTRIMRMRAETLMQALKTMSEDDVEAMVRRFQGFPNE